MWQREGIPSDLEWLDYIIQIAYVLLLQRLYFFFV